MRKLIVMLCALFVLAGCGSVAKEVAPQAQDKPEQSPVVVSTANISVSSLVVVEQMLVENRLGESSAASVATAPIDRAEPIINRDIIIIDVSGMQTPIDALLANMGSSLEYEIVPEGVLVTVGPATPAEAILQGEEDTHHVLLTQANEFMIFIDPQVPAAYAAVETQPLVVVY